MRNITIFSYQARRTEGFTGCCCTRALGARCADRETRTTSKVASSARGTHGEAISGCNVANLRNARSMSRNELAAAGTWQGRQTLEPGAAVIVPGLQSVQLTE